MTDTNSTANPQRTPLYEKHLESKGKIVDFASWEMPINYGSQVSEHKQVREDAGMFDVSHMVILDLQGADVKRFLQYLLANDVDKLKQPGKALYSAMLNHDGGVIDDLIVYYLSRKILGRAFRGWSETYRFRCERYFAFRSRNESIRYRYGPKH